MNNEEILKNAPKRATHIAFSNFNSSHQYLQTDTDIINNWYHWVDETKHHVDYEFTVVYDDIRSLDDIKRIVELEDKLGLVT